MRGFSTQLVPKSLEFFITDSGFFSLEHICLVLCQSRRTPIVDLTLAESCSAMRRKAILRPQLFTGGQVVAVCIFQEWPTLSLLCYVVCPSPQYVKLKHKGNAQKQPPIVKKRLSCFKTSTRPFKTSAGLVTTIPFTRLRQYIMSSFKPQVWF
jgi:hypothetical protein